MAREGKKENLITSWKGIAAYLNCDVRTCMRWEKKYGLPVHRIDGLFRATVFAYKDELDDWLAELTDGKSLLQESSAKKWRGKHTFYFLVAVVVILAVRFFLLSRITSTPLPADFRIEKAELVVLNEEGKELWRFDTGIENLVEEKTYRDHFQYKRLFSTGVNLPHLMIRDINGDGKPEVLFSTQTQNEFGEGELLCFNSKGSLLWKFEAGRELKCGRYVFSLDYSIEGFLVYDLDDDGRLEIIVSSTQWKFYPTQLAVLDAGGRVLGEYWNSGHIADIAFVDLNDDGRREILAVGCNHEYTKGCLFVFDPRLVKGSSPQSDDFKCEELEPGSEKYYVLFPRTEVNMLESPSESISTIAVLKNRRLAIRACHSHLLYILDYNLEVQEVHFTQEFMRKYRRAVLEGKIYGELNEEYEKKLGQDLLYFDGKGWVSQPTTTGVSPARVTP